MISITSLSLAEGGVRIHGSVGRCYLPQLMWIS
jgi:hypothetical protein